MYREEKSADRYFKSAMVSFAASTPLSALQLRPAQTHCLFLERNGMALSPSLAVREISLALVSSAAIVKQQPGAQERLLHRANPFARLTCYYQ